MGLSDQIARVQAVIAAIREEVGREPESALIDGLVSIRSRLQADPAAVPLELVHRVYGDEVVKRGIWFDYHD